jgi:hypothetical protein
MSHNRSRSSELPPTTKILRHDGPTTTLAKERSGSPMAMGTLNNRIASNHTLTASTTDQGGSSRSGSSMGLSTTNQSLSIVRRTVADDSLLAAQARRSHAHIHNSTAQKVPIWDRLFKETLQKDRHRTAAAKQPPLKPHTIDWDTLEPPPRKANQAPTKPVRTLSPKVKRVQLSHVAQHPGLDVVLYTPHPGMKEPFPKGPCHNRTLSNVSDSVSEATDTTTTSAGAAIAFGACRTPARACSESDAQSEGTDLSIVDCGSHVGQGTTADYKRALKTARSNREAHSLTTKDLLRKGASGQLGDADDLDEFSEDGKQPA